MDRKRLIVAAVLLVLFILSIFGASLLLNEWNGRRGQVGRREPLPGLAYCSSQQIRPCILAFNLDPAGGMLINLLVRGSTPDFYVKIRHPAGEYRYECKKARLYSINVFCTGERLPVGETYSFLLISKAANTTLSEGSFPIIGMALATPEVYITPTPIILDRPPR